jgi:hypothetical protein
MATSTPTPTPTSTPTPTPTPAPPPISGLVFYYDPGDPASYPGTGNTINDLSGNGNNALLFGPNISYSGVSGGVFTITGLSSTYILGPDLNQFYSGWTMYMAFNATSAFGYNMMRSNSANGNNGMYNFGNELFIDYNNNQTANGTTQIINTNTWYLAGASVSGTTLASQLFSAGNQRYETFTKFIGFGNFDQPITICKDFFSGQIGVMLMYNRPLSQSELTQLNNYFKSRYGY